MLQYITEYDAIYGARLYWWYFLAHVYVIDTVKNLASQLAAYPVVPGSPKYGMAT